MNRRTLLGLVCAFAAIGLSACKKDAAPAAEVKELTVAEASLAQKSGAAFFDANTDDFRKENGKVPGATLLASSHDYELSVLPSDKDKPLVFYCTSKT
ncbi:MAG: rhodanese-like domain-containing protein [Myxococcaceae bacterium]